MASDDPNSGLLPLLEPDQDSRVSTLPGGRGEPGGPVGPMGGPLPPPPPSGAHGAAAGGSLSAPPEGLDPTAALAASLARVADQAEHALVDLAPAPERDALLTMEAVVADPEPAPEPAPGPAALPPAGPAAPEALELDLDRAGISRTRGMATPGDSVEPSAPGPSPAASVASAPVAARSPDVRPEGRGHLLGSDPLTRGLFALAIGLLLALPVAREAARRLDRDRMQPLLEELEESARRPLAARAGAVRSLDAIGAELESARGEVRGRFLLVWAGVGLALGAGLFFVPRPG